MWDEDDLGAALRTELAQRTPPRPRAGLADAVARGRRRRRRQQFGATLAAVAAVAAVAGVAVSAGALPSGGQNVAATRAPLTGTSPTEAPWPRAELPARSPNTTWTPAPTALPPAGWPTEPVPRCETPDLTGRDLDSVRVDLPELQQQVWQAVAAVTPTPSTSGSASTTLAGASRIPTPVADGTTVGLVGELKLPSTRPDAGLAFTYTADVSDAGGIGSVVLSFGRFTGDPLAAADEQAYDLGNCQPPKRHVLADGTVLQLYDVAPSDPFATLSQTLRIYRPDGRLQSLSVQNFGSPDLALNRQDTGHPHRVGPGRPTLPLTEGQIAELGLTLAG